MGIMPVRPFDLGLGAGQKRLARGRIRPAVAQPAGNGLGLLVRRLGRRAVAGCLVRSMGEVDVKYHPREA